MSNLPIHLFKGMHYLTQDLLEESLLAEEHKQMFTSGEWHSRINKNTGIFIDLSQVRFVHIGALVQLTLFIESAKKNSVMVYIALPSTARIEGEETIYNSKTKEYEKEISAIQLRKKLNEDRFNTLGIELKNKNITDDQKETIRNKSLEIQKTITSDRKKIEHLATKINSLSYLLLNKRKHANNFLKTLQFDEVAKCKHITNKIDIKITEEFRFSKEKINKDTFFTYFKKELREIDYSRFSYKTIFPLKWVTQTEKDFIKFFDQEFVKIISNRDRGLSHIDAQSLKNVIFYELLKNVDEHAGVDTKYGLLAVGLFPVSRLRKEANNEIKYPNSIEKDYIDWLIDSKINNYIEVYFGDSGTGILNENFATAYTDREIDLQKSKDKNILLEWTFDKWSTSKRHESVRGTKGIYRIKRVVDKYRGNIFIRTGNSYGGYERGGNSDLKWKESSTEMYYSPGTCIQLKLNPYSEIVRFNFILNNDDSAEDWKLFYLNKDEMAANKPKFLKEWLDKSIKKLQNKNALFVLNIDIDSLNKPEKGIEEVLRGLSKARALDNSIVIYFPFCKGKEALDSIIDSVQKTIVAENSSSPDQDIRNVKSENIFDPVLVIGKERSLHWYGGDNDIISILNEISEHPSDMIPIHNLKSYKNLNKDKQNSIRLYLESAAKLVQRTQDGEILFKFSNIRSIFQETARALLDTCNKEKKVLTPKLEFRKSWCNIKGNLKKEKPEFINKFAIAMYFIAIEEFGILADDTPLNLDDLSNARIFIDHKQQLALANEFKKIAKIGKQIYSVSDDIDINLPKRVELFEKDEKVIILTTIISSTETIREMLKQILRDGAQPLFVLTIAYFHSKDNPPDKITTWDRPTPILSLYTREKELRDGQNSKCEKIDTDRIVDDKVAIIRVDNLEDGKVTKKDKFKNKDEEVTQKKQLIRDYIIKTNSMYYGHIGKFNNRHFTFYLNKEKLLKKNIDSEKIIFEKYYENIRDWADKNDIEVFNIYYPKLNKEKNGIFDDCVNYLIDKFDIQDKGKYIKVWDGEHPGRIFSQNVVYIDFGSLTGSTVDRFLSSLVDTSHIHISLLFAQINSSKRKLYTQIRGYEVPRNNVLFSLGTSTATLDIKYIYDLHLENYTVTTCPICEHRESLRKYTPDDSYLEPYYKERKDLLSIKDRTDVGEFPKDFYDFEHDDTEHSMSGEFVMKLYELKLRMECAVKDTVCRINLYNHLCDIHENINGQITDKDSDLFVFLYYISYELHWLKKEPLRFRKFKTVISEIALKVAEKNLEELKNGLKEEAGGESKDIFFHTRYKFAAITVLRAANKKVFFNNLYRIVSSSFYSDGNISSRLFYNIVYHINSLYVNVYNKSIIHFETIRDELGEVISSVDLMPKQKALIHNILSKNNYFLQKNLLRTKKQLDFVKSLKVTIEEEFGDEANPKTHPDVTQCMDSINFEDFFKAAGQSIEERENSPYYYLFQAQAQGLVDEWKKASDYLDVLYPYLTSLKEDIFMSEQFKGFSSSYLSNYNSNKEKFTNLIYQIHDNPLFLIDNREEYEEYFRFFYDGFLGMKEGGSSYIFPKLNHLLYQIPSSIPKTIDNYFRKEDFHEINYKNKLNQNVFYPQHMLNHQIRLIKNNISEHNRLNRNKTTKDVSILIEMQEENEHIICTISNNNTSETNHYVNTSGGLLRIQKDFKRFGGDLTYDSKSVKNWFTVKLKLKKY